MKGLPTTLQLYGQTINFHYQNLPFSVSREPTHQCGPDFFYLSIPNIARFLALPKENLIQIERADDTVPIQTLNTWLLGTMLAYILQYHGYLVLHGSSVLINGKAVIFSGQSGAGKSTLAASFMQKGYSFLTDDLVVIQPDDQQNYCILPGSKHLKLWSDSLNQLAFDAHNAIPMDLKKDKFALPVTEGIHKIARVPISHFYEINQHHELILKERQTPIQALRTIMNNAYRYFMLEPLGKLPQFLKDCTVLANQISVHQLFRIPDFQMLPKLIQMIELNQGIMND